MSAASWSFFPYNDPKEDMLQESSAAGTAASTIKSSKTFASHYYVWSEEVLPSISPVISGADLWYTVSFRFRQNSENKAGSTGAPPTFKTFNLRLAKSSHRADNQNAIAWQSDNNFQQLDIRDQAGAVSQEHKITFDSLADESNQATQWQTYTATFRPSSSCTGCTLFFHVQQSTWTPGHLGGNEFFFADVQLSRAAVQLPPVPMFEGGKFRVANWHRPPVPSDLGAPQSACPAAERGLKLWHEAATWGSGVPAAGTSRVDIPDNSKVLVCRCSLPAETAQAASPFGQIHVPATSELIFDDAPIALHVGSITVHGALRAGAPTCRHNWPMNVTFHGSKQAVLSGGGSASSGHSKGLVVSGSGQLDLHGRRFFPTWTRLRAAVWPTERRLELQDAVNWEVGQRVLLVTSIWRDEEDNQNEVRRITAVSADGRTLMLDAPVTHMHWAGEEYQTEVALLDRVLTLQGAEGDSSVATGGFGGHVMWTGAAVGRVSGARFFRMGQTNQLARYAVHMHLLGDGGAQSYVSDSAVEQSFYRCIVVHGTNQATVNENVCFDVTGHAIYMSEDGNEENNDITYNLAAYVHVIGRAAAGGGQGGEVFLQSDELTNPADAAAAGFYITNAWNTIKGNAASGGWTGFSHPNLAEFIGIFKDQVPADNMTPENRPTKVWIGNTAHSSGYQWSRGSCMYVGGRLWHDEDSGGLLKYRSGREKRDTKLPDGSEAWMRFEDTRVWLCQRGINHWGNQIELYNYEVTDSTRAAVLFGEALVKGAVITGRSGNPAATMDRRGFQAYDTWVKTMLVDVTFRNFDSSKGDYCVFAMTHSPEFKPQFINAARDIKWENVDRQAYYYHEPRPPYSTGSARMYSWWSPDGTLVDRHGPWIVGSHTDWWHLDDATCEWDTQWAIWMCKAKPQRSIAHITLVVPGEMQNNAEPPANFLGYSSLLRANRSIPFTKNPGLTGIAGPSGWYLRLNKGAPVQLDTELITIKRGHYVPLAVKYPPGTTFTVKLFVKWYVWPQNQRYDVPEASSLDDIFAPADAGLKSQAELVGATCTGSTVSGVAGTLCDKASMGADGPLWFFDGDFLWLRVVQPTYYLDRTFQRKPWWTREGLTIQDLEGGFKYEIRANCPRNTLVHGNDYCSVPDSIPLAGQPMPGDVDTSDDDAIWVKPSASGTPAPPAPSASNSAAPPAPSASNSPAPPRPSSDPTSDPRPSASSKPDASPSDEPRPSASGKPDASPSDEPRPSASGKPDASPSDEPRPSASGKPDASPSDEPRPSASGKPDASPSDDPKPSASPSPIDVCADMPQLCGPGKCMTRPAESASASADGDADQHGNVWTAPTRDTVYCVCPEEWTGMFCTRPVEADVPTDREVPAAAARAKLCADGKRSLQAVLTADGPMMHVESDVDCGSSVVASVADSAVVSACKETCALGMGCFGDDDCAGSANGATKCRVLPSSGEELVRGGLQLRAVTGAGNAAAWTGVAPGTCVRSGLLEGGVRGLMLRVWLWGVSKEDFAEAGMSHVLPHALGRAVAAAWMAAKGKAAALGDGVTWSDLISVLRVASAVREGSAGRQLQAAAGSSGAGAAGVEVHVLVQGVSGVDEGDLKVAARDAVQGGGALSEIISSVPGAPVSGLSSDVDEAEVSAVAAAAPAGGGAGGAPAASAGRDDGGDGGAFGSVTVIAAVAAVVGVALVVVGVLLVRRRQAAKDYDRAMGKQAKHSRSASFSAVPGQHMVNPLAAGGAGVPVGGGAARGARIKQLQMQFQK